MADEEMSVIRGVRNVILVLSGKGGVGKSTVSTQIALGLKSKGHKVGLLDIDLCGPSIPFLLGLEGSSIHQSTAGWVPVYTDESQKLGVISIGFLLNNRTSSVVWRGPKKTDMIKQFLRNVFWDNVDYLIVDTPPGTSDEHITIMAEVKAAHHGAIVVTTPQRVALDDVRKEITLCRKIGIKVIGLIENLSGFVCPSCKECTNIWSSGGGASLAEYTGVPLLGVIPIDPALSKIPSDSLGTLVPKIFDDIATHIITAYP